MRLLVALVLSSWLVLPAAAAQDAATPSFEDGLALYDAASAGGDPEDPRYARAREIWEPLAAAGDTRAIYHLGMLHFFGLGGAGADQGQALALIQRSAQGGYHVAQSFLGFVYENGIEMMLERDPRSALAWYRRAADAGHCVSVRRLERAYAEGELGLAPDPARARAWHERRATCRRR